LSLQLSDTRVYEPQIRARLGTTAHLCKVVVLKQVDDLAAVTKAVSKDGVKGLFIESLANTGTSVVSQKLFLSI